MPFDLMQPVTDELTSDLADTIRMPTSLEMWEDRTISVASPIPHSVYMQLFPSSHRDALFGVYARRGGFAVVHLASGTEMADCATDTRAYALIAGLLQSDLAVEWTNPDPAYFNRLPLDVLEPFYTWCFRCAGRSDRAIEKALAQYRVRAEGMLAGF